MAIVKFSGGSEERKGTFNRARRYKVPKERPARWTIRADRALGAPRRPAGSTTPPANIR